MNDSVSARVVKLVNTVLVIAAVTMLAAVYWFAWRPLAKRSGTIEAAIGAEIEVNYDERGEPHIRARSLDDALFAQGYVTAQDRMFQMDVLRRFSAGELSEIFGQLALETDTRVRLWSPTSDREWKNTMGSARSGGIGPGVTWLSPLHRDLTYFTVNDVYNHTIRRGEVAGARIEITPLVSLGTAAIHFEFRDIDLRKYVVAPPNRAAAR